MELGDDRREQPEVPRARLESDRDCPDPSIFRLARLAHRDVNTRQNRLRPLQKQTPGQRQLHATPGRLEQIDTDLLLELLHLAAERRLRDVQFLSGAAEVLFLGDHDEVAYVTKLHGRFSATDGSIDTYQVSIQCLTMSWTQHRSTSTIRA